MLHDESGITPEVIAARGYRTVTKKAELAKLGFSMAQRLPPALVLPIYNPYGEIVLYQARPDTPRVRDGKPLKYETPAKAHMALDVPPLQQNRLRLHDPSIPLWITEGCKKADALVTYDCCAIALLGVWNWRGTNDASGKTVLADFEAIALNDRQVYLVFDSDVMTKREVYKALERFGSFLASRDAEVRYVYLPSGESGKKIGVDDFLVARHTVDDLVALATSTLRPLPHNDEAPVVPYKATPQGLIWLKPTRDAYVVETLLTNFTATIAADIAQDDGAETRRLFELEARHSGETTRCTVPAAHFASMAWVNEHLGATALVMPGMLLKDHARAAIQMLSRNIEQRRVYTHIGWRKLGESWCYLHAGGAIGTHGDMHDVAVAPGDALTSYRLLSPPNGEAACVAIRASFRVLDVAPDAVTIPVFTALWRVVLGKVDFSLHMAGPTGQGKTAIAALVQQHWGAGMDARRLPASWSSTCNALEGLAFQAKDAVLVVDDFCPTGSYMDIQRYHREADRILRAQGNNSGRQRMRPDSTLRPVKFPRGLILSTGEDIPRGQSLRARILILDVLPGIVHWEQMTACQGDAEASLYTQALAGFVRWLAPRYDEIVQSLPAELRSLRQQALQGGHRRTPDMVANLALGMQYVLAYAHDCSALTLEECRTYWERTWQALGDVAAAQQEHQAGEEPASRFLALLVGTIAAGHAHVADAKTLQAPTQDSEYWGWREKTIGTGDNVREERQPCGACVGWLHDTRLYLEPEAAFHAVQRFAEGQQAPLPITQRTLWKRMREQGMLVTQPSQAQNTVSRRIGPDQKTTRVLDLSVALFSPENSIFSNNSIQSYNSQKNKADSGYCFPVWHSIPQYRASDKNSITPSIGSRPTTGADRESVDTVSDTVSDVETMDKTSVQHVEKSAHRTYGIADTEDTVRGNDISRKLTDVSIPLPANGISLAVGDWVWVLSADGIQQNATPYQVQAIALGPDGRLYAQFAETTTGWSLSQCERTDPPASIPIASPPPEAQPPPTTDPGGTQACPQCSQPLSMVVGGKGVFCRNNACRYRAMVVS
jgi:hypothetical protein